MRVNVLRVDLLLVIQNSVTHKIINIALTDNIYIMLK